MIRTTLIALSIALCLAACSAQQQPSEQQVPQCLSLCANQFASCTEEFPGDAAACLPARRDCEQECESQKAMKRMEDGRQGIQAPVDPPDIIRPAADAGAPAPDSGELLD